MIPPKFIKSLLVTSLFIAATSFADTKVVEVKDWALWESTVDKNDVCYMQSSNKAIFRAEDYYLEISKLKNKIDSPVEIWMRIDKNKKGSTGLITTVNASSTQISFSDMNDQKAKFWGVAKDLSQLIQQLKDGRDDVAVKAKGGKKEVDFNFTGRGFSEVLSEMEKRCNAGSPLVNTSFESDFLGSVANSIEPTRIASSVTNQLRTLYFSAYSVSSQISDTQAALEKVLAKYQPLINELKTNQVQSAQIINQDLPNRKATLVDSQQQQVDAKNEIARLDSILPGLIAQVQNSQKAYDAARAVLAPLEPEYNRLTGNIRSSQQALNEAQSRLSVIDSRLRDITQQISALNVEVENLERYLPQKRNDLDRALSIFRQAEQQRLQYNIFFEKDRRLRSNGEYNRILSERSSVESDLSRNQNEANQLRAERDRIARSLQQCQASPAPVPPAPPKNCSQLQQGLDRANIMLRQKETEQRNLMSRRDQLNVGLANIERQVDFEVRREYDRLVQQEQQARQEANGLQDSVNLDQSRISQIRISDLPRLENERTQLSSERPNVIARLGQANSDVDRWNHELAQFKTLNDWVRKAADLDAKSRQLNLDQSNLTKVQNQKLETQSRFENAVETEIQMKKQIESLNAQLVSLNKRAAILEESIKGLPAERAVFDKKITALQGEFLVQKNNFLNLLRQ